MASRRFGLFTGLVALLAIWVLAVGLRATGHFPNVVSQWNHDDHYPPPTTASASAAEDLAAQLAAVAAEKDALKAREAKIAEEEKKLKKEQTALMEDKAKMRNERPKSLISYVYTESPTNRRNLEFFIKHGLYAGADFVFSFNGDTDAETILPVYETSPWYDPKITNIEVLKRDNKCFDMGAHGEALLREWNDLGTKLSPMGGRDRGGRKFWEGYERFMLMNASVRGPFMPIWSKDCWSEAFWGMLTDKKKLAGMSYNCHGGKGHVQSMVWALDRVGIEILMKPEAEGGIGYWCPYDMVNAIGGEIRSTPSIINAGYEVEAMNLVYHSHDGEDHNKDGKKDNSPKGYIEGCTDDDFFHDNYYYGFNIHPYETIFMKAARNMQDVLIGNFTEWTDGSGYSSYEACAQ
ncbi:hypothetical protein V491_04256 [Pseudogymnoascus sp. VKM F-3775]|nr:hypothetical protein V491_04256 [Pseudogymnoascus sp. VKM F-3775]